MRRPAPATVIATIALVFAVAPVGEAASGWVKRALYARNAGSVDGIRASRTPHKGKLIALPASGKLPMSILPASLKGARGPAGPAGSDGTDGSGGSVLVATAGSAVNVGTAQTAVVTLQLKPGSYALVAKASLHATLDTSTPGVTCLLKAGSDGDQADADLSSSSDDPGGVDRNARVRSGRRRHAHVRGRRLRRGRQRRAHHRAPRHRVDVLLARYAAISLAGRATTRSSRTTASSASATAGSSCEPAIASTSAQAESKSSARR